MRALFLLVPLLLAPAVRAQSTGTLAGRVRDVSTGAPIPAAYVALEGASGTRQATTDPEGYFRLQSVPSGTYAVTVGAWAHTPVTHEVTISGKQKASFALRGAVVVEYELPIIPRCYIGAPFVAEQRAEVLAYLARATGSLAGRVGDAATGEGLPSANVILVGTELGAATDLDGSYRIIGIPVGSYDITARFVGYEEQTAEDVRISAGYVKEQDFRLREDNGGIVFDGFVCYGPPLISRDPFASRVLSGEEIARMPINW
jgi:hypothetical protein